MDAQSAVALVNALVYKPGWTIAAQCHDRFEDTVRVRITYPTFNANRDQAPCYPTPIQASAEFPLITADCCDGVGIYRRLADLLIAVEIHEMREFLRVAPTWRAPFHPHRLDGMRRWGDVGGDLMFGIA